jgi:hypothetical protein
MNIRTLGIVSIVVVLAFGFMASMAVYNLAGWIVIPPVILAITAVVLAIIARMRTEEEYQRKLFWGDVQIVDERLMSANPRNVTDAQELIKVLKERLLDVDEARMEAVRKYNDLLEELGEDV